MELCQCGCGLEVSNFKNRFIYGHSNRGSNNPNFGKKHTEEAKRKMALVDRQSSKYCTSLSNGIKEYYRNNPAAMSGVNNPRWIDDRTQVDGNGYSLDLSDEDTAIRGHQTSCEECGKSEEDNGRKMDRHHLDEDKTNTTLDNFMLLCISCHARIHARDRVIKTI